ncbi:hypothetical protein AnigIFM56816_006720 [Aspergillus niger]|nr:hypothetical protein AnigIFM56816_006720 [Aspergillus niger]
MDLINNVAYQVTSTNINSSIKAFKSLIESDPKLYKLSTEMFTQTRPGDPTIPSNLATSIVSNAFHDILKDWGGLLRTTELAAVLTDEPNGWFSPDALSNMRDFEKTFICDPSKPHWEFDS